MMPVQTSREPGDAELAAAARAGSPAAFATLVERYQPVVLRYLYHRTGDPQLAADLTQETFLTAWRQVGRLRDERAFAGWLYRIAANQLRMAWRRERGMLSLDWLAERGAAIIPAVRHADQAARAGERDAIGRALSTLSPKVREALLLHTLWGFSAAEVAEIQSISLWRQPASGSAAPASIFARPTILEILMPDRCDRPIEDLHAYHDGDLSDADRDAIHAHVAGCAFCRSRLEGLRQTATTLRTAPIPVDEGQLVRAIQARIAPTAQRRPAHHAHPIHTNSQTDDGPLVSAARPDDRRQKPTRRRRLREAGQFVAAGLAIALVAGLLVALFRDTDDSRDDGGGTGSPVASVPVAATTDAPVRLIAWANDVYGDGAFKVVVADSIGADPHKVMPGPFFEDISRERSPVWSPDGSMMALVTDRDGNDELYVVSGRHPGSMPSQNPSVLETSGPRNITNDPGTDSDPVWSPDGEWIAFSSRRFDNLDIYAVQPGSPETTQLTTSPGADSDPAWSPDGSRIAYRSERRDGTGSYDIIVMNPDGSDPHRVSTGDGYSSSPVWSPDGQQLAFTTILYDETGTAQRIQTNVVNLQTGETRTIANDPFPIVDNAAQVMVGADSVDWSEDGTLLAFSRPVGEQYDIAIASPDGSGLTMLTNTPDRDEVAPFWSPESLQLLYQSLPHDPTGDTTASAELRLIDRSGTNDRHIAPLTVDAVLFSRAAWGPLASEAGEPIPDPGTPESTVPPTVTSATRRSSLIIHH